MYTYTYTHKMNNYSAIKKEWNYAIYTIGIDLEIIILSEVR